MSSNCKKAKSGSVNRRGFIQTSALAGAAAALPAGALGFGTALDQENSEQKPKPVDPDSVKTNLATALAVPRTKWSLPGLYPGVVAEVQHAKVTEGFNPNHTSPEIAAEMLAAGMKSLTGTKDELDAWSELFSPQDRVGIKVNPVGGKLLSNTHEILWAIINNLEAIGVKKSNIVIWDRFGDTLLDSGYNSENYPGIKCEGFSYWTTKSEEQLAEARSRIDENHYYEFAVEGKYEEKQMRDMMLNEGTKSYFFNLVTQGVDKIINAAVLKNAGPLVTLCLKNITFGSTSNCRRGHEIGLRYMSEICAFPPLRDKVVLNLIDGLRGCWEGGPMAVARYIWPANRIWLSTDPVAIDKLGWGCIFEKQVAEGTAKPGELEERMAKYNKLARAENLGLGVFSGREIDHRKTSLT